MCSDAQGLSVAMLPRACACPLARRPAKKSPLAAGIAGSLFKGHPLLSDLARHLPFDRSGPRSDDRKPRSVGTIARCGPQG